MSTAKQARVNIVIELDVLRAVRELAAQERRPFSAQVQLMLEHQLAARSQ
jgi:hypothetical protein